MYKLCLRHFSVYQHRGLPLQRYRFTAYNLKL